jgi:hypothetical protein
VTTRRDERKKALEVFSEARAIYLRSAGWALSEKNIPSGPRWWVDPTPVSLQDQLEYREDGAVGLQERRDNVAVHR